MLERILNQTSAAEKALQGTWVRNEAISQNLANVDTPGYKRKTVSFEQQLSDAMDNSGFKGFRTDPRHIVIGGGGSADEVEINTTEDNSSLSMRLDGNNVDIDSEMADMAKNTIAYNTLVQSISAQYKRILSAISEGRK